MLATAGRARALNDGSFPLCRELPQPPHARAPQCRPTATRHIPDDDPHLTHQPKQIWDLASAGQPVLLLPQFAAAMRLVALAQLGGGRLPPPDQARLAASGQGPPLPPPRLAGVGTGAPPAGYAPQLTGASSVPAAAPGGYLPQMTGASAMGAAGAGPGAAAYAPQVTGAAAYGYIPQATGGSMIMPGAAAAGPTGGGPPPVGAPFPPLPPNALPPASPADSARYLDLFRQLDADRDGLVRGAEAFAPLAGTGVERGVLKRVWDSVAPPGGAAALPAPQFACAMYLAEALRAVGPSVAAQVFATPRALPPLGPGSFPPVVQGVPSLERASGGGGVGAGVAGAAAPAPAAAATPPVWTLASQFGGAPASKVVADAYDNPAPKFPKAPGKAVWDPKLQQVVVDGKTVVTPGGSGEGESGLAGATGAGAGLTTGAGSAAALQAAGLTTPSSAEQRPPVPDLDAQLKASLPEEERKKLDAAREEAATKDRTLRDAESDALVQRRRGEAFAQVLGEVALFRSRTDVALLQAKEEAESLRREADEFERRYERQQDEVEERRRRGDEAATRVRAALAAREEASTRLRLLKEELEMVARLNPQEVAALEKEVSELASRAAAAEAEKAAAALALESGKAQRDLLASRVDDLKMAAAAAEAELGRTRAEVEEVAKRARQAAKAAAGVVGEGEGDKAAAAGGGAEIAALLSRAAAAYRSLHSAAAAHGVEVPYEASVSTVGGLVWLEQLMAGTADWAEWGGGSADDATAGGDNAAAAASGAPISASLLPAAVGYALVNTLPDLEGVPPALLRPTTEIFVVRQQQQPPQEEEEQEQQPEAAGGGEEGKEVVAAVAVAAAAEDDRSGSKLSPAASGGPAMRPRASSGSGAVDGAVAATAAAGAATAAAAATDGDDDKVAPPPEAAAAPAPQANDEEEDAVTPLAADHPPGEPPLQHQQHLRTDDDSDVLSSDPGGGNHHNPLAQQPAAFHRSLTTQSSGFEAANAFAGGEGGEAGEGGAAVAAAAGAAAGAAPDEL
jgi:hypothetical protein